MNPVLTIDPEFEAKCPPLTEDELSQLEENILEPLPHRAGASGHRIPYP